MMQKADRILSGAAATLIGTYFWRLVRPTLHLYFSPDDLMNLYRSWILPASWLARDNALFFPASPFERPLGSVLYRAIFLFAGFRPGPFHAVLLVLLYCNIYLTYCVARRLSGSRLAALVAALVGSYYNRLGSLYFDTGFIFDVLCYCCYFAAFLFYVRIRQSRRLLRGRELAALAAIYILALNSKEMAVTLPGLLVCYEALYHAPAAWRRADWRQAMPIGVLGLMTLVFVAGRALGSLSLTKNPAYAPHFSAAQFLLTSRHYFGDMVESGQMATSAQTFGLWCILLLVALAARSRTLLFAWLLFVLTPLPIAFILPRGPAQYYIPWFGLTLYAAVVISSVWEWSTQWLTSDRYWLIRARGAALLLAMVALLYPHFKRIGWDFVTSESIEAPLNAMIVRELRSLHSTLPRQSKVLFLNDPIPADWWNMLFLVRLSYRDPTLTVDCAKRIGRPGDEKLATYNHVFDYAGGRFFELQRPWIRSPSPMVGVNYRGSEFFHLDWSPVTPARPAEPGEEVMAKAVDLGGTVEVHVAGETAKVSQKAGWPDEVNAYRVDFRVPACARPGRYPVQLSSDGVSGVSTDLLVGWPMD